MNGVVMAGGGLAAQRCAETLRAAGYEGPVRLVCGEAEAPYDRPPLSKGFLAGKPDSASVSLRVPTWYEENDVELLLGRRASGLDPVARKLELDDGTKLPYDSLLIATGSEPRHLPVFGDFRNVHVLRTVADARRLRDELRPGGRIAIVGAGFIGLEVAATARALGVDVVVVEALPVPLGHILGDEVGRWLVEMHEAEGVEFRLGARLEGALGNGSVEELELAGGERLGCDTVVVGIGVAPTSGWLAGSGLEWEGGVPTDAAGRTAIPGVFAAGDVARAFDPRLGEHARTEHWDAASRQGSAVARTILGDEPPPPPLPSFWSDQFGSRIRYVGHAHLADERRLDGEPGEPGLTVAYHAEGRPVAALVVDRPRDLARLRRAIEEAPAGLEAPNEEKKR